MQSKGGGFSFGKLFGPRIAATDKAAILYELTLTPAASHVNKKSHSRSASQTIENHYIRGEEVCMGEEGTVCTGEGESSGYLLCCLNF